MIKVARCKALARETLRGRYAAVVGAEILRLIVSLILGAAAVSSIVAAIFYGGSGKSHSLAVIITGSCLFTIFLFLFVIFTIYMSIGMYKLLLNICTGERYSVADIFYGFRGGVHAGRVFWIGVILFLIEYVFHLVFSALASLYYRMNGADSAAGIALCLAVTLVLELILYWILMGYYVSGLTVLSDPTTTIGEALSRSRSLMKGAKLKAFWLDKISFILWDILTLICFPARLWVSPYKKMSKVVLFLAASGELDLLQAEDADANAIAAEAPAAPAEAEPGPQEPVTTEPGPQEPVTQEPQPQETVTPEEAVTPEPEEAASPEPEPESKVKEES